MTDDQTEKSEVEDTDDGDAEGDNEVVIGEEKLNADEATELVKSGKSFKELTEKYPDIDFNELPKSFTQARQELADLKKKPVEPQEELDEKEIARQKQIKDFFADPLVKEELSKTQEEKLKAEREDSAFNRVMESLEAELDGEDGRPKFEREKVLAYGMEHQNFDPRSCYNDMHETELDEWKIKQANEKKRPTTFFERRGGQGSKQPDAKTPTTFKEAEQAAMEREIEE
jgi:hypothetical protein